MSDSKLSRFLSRNSNKILTGTTISSFGVALWRMYVSSPRIHYTIEDFRIRWEEAKTAEERKRLLRYVIKDILLDSWSVSTPAILGVICAIVNAHNNDKKIGEWAFAYSALESFANRYQREVKKELGENKERDIKDRAIASYSNDPQCNIRATNNVQDGDWIVYDAISKQMIISNSTKVQSALNNVYDKCRQHMSCPYSDFLIEIGGDPSLVPDGILIKEWNVDDGIIRPIWTADFDNNGRPIAILHLDVEPKDPRKSLHDY